jgi:hypothetical protein
MWNLTRARREWPALLLLAAWCLLSVAPGAAMASETTNLRDVLKATGLKHVMQGESTACLLMRGKAGVHPVIVRSLKGRLAVMCEIVRAQPERAPTALWKKLAQVNAAPRLAHAGLQDGCFYAVAGATVQQVDARLLKAMVVDVAVMADELQPVLKDLLAVE